jgi:RNA polymerase sigma factor (sigma-70 family)
MDRAEPANLSTVYVCVFRSQRVTLSNQLSAGTAHPPDRARQSAAMATTSTDFESLLGRLRLGDEDAAWDLVCEYGPHVVAVLRRRLRNQIRVRVDSQDLAQAVWKSFFLGIGDMAEIRSPEQLMAALVRMAQHKLIDAYRGQLYAVSNGAVREVPFISHDTQGEQFCGREATPSQFAIARERWQQMLKERSPEQQEVLRRRMTGESFEAIADSLGISARTARRVVGDLWREHCHDQA